MMNHVRIAKIVAPVIGVLLFAAPVFAQSTDVQSQIASLLAQIKQLQTLVAQLQGQSSALSCSTFADLTYGNFDTDPGGRVSQLQTWLGISSNTFGFGTYGPKTRALWNSRCGGTQPMPSTVTYQGPCGKVSVPQCTNSTPVSLGTDTNGCSLGYTCKGPSSACPDYERPQCTDGTAVSLGLDSRGCSLGYQCKARSVACPDIKPPQCDGTIVNLGVDTNGCSAGYACKNTTSNSQTGIPAITLISLNGGESISDAQVVPISWRWEANGNVENSTHQFGANVWLVREDGTKLDRLIAYGTAVNGSPRAPWKVGLDAWDMSMAVPPGKYKLRVEVLESCPICDGRGGPNVRATDESDGWFTIVAGSKY